MRRCTLVWISVLPSPLSNGVCGYAFMMGLTGLAASSMFFVVVVVVVFGVFVVVVTIDKRLLHQTA